MTDGKTLAFRTAAIEVLRRAHQPLSAEEIVSRALAARLIAPSGKTPVKTMTAILYLDVARNAETPFLRVAREGRTRAARGSVQWTLKAKGIPAKGRVTG
jgi:hypothetical protein